MIYLPGCRSPCTRQQITARNRQHCLSYIVGVFSIIVFEKISEDPDDDYAGLPTRYTSLKLIYNISLFLNHSCVYHLFQMVNIENNSFT